MRINLLASDIAVNRNYFDREIISRAPDYARAFADYSKMIELNPNDALGYRLRGVLFLVPRRDSEAEPLARNFQLRPDEKSCIKGQIDSPQDPWRASSTWHPRGYCALAEFR